MLSAYVEASGELCALWQCAVRIEDIMVDLDGDFGETWVASCLECWPESKGILRTKPPDIDTPFSLRSSDAAIAHCPTGTASA